jgi:hypothetical protein
MPPEICPQCGATVPPQARACPHCGSDEKTGWSEEASTADLDLPEDSFDYEGFVEREFGGARVRPRGLAWLWWIAAVLLLLTLLGLVFRGWI